MENNLKDLKCPICGGNCIVISVANMYLKMVKKFFENRDENSNIPFRKYPVVGEVGECKKTGERIYLCPYCKKPFKGYYNVGEPTITCPNCGETLTVPISNRSYC